LQAVEIMEFDDFDNRNDWFEWKRTMYYTRDRKIVAEWFVNRANILLMSRDEYTHWKKLYPAFLRSLKRVRDYSDFDSDDEDYSLPQPPINPILLPEWDYGHDPH